MNVNSQNPPTIINGFEVNPRYNTRFDIFAYLKQKTNGQGLTADELHSLVDAAVSGAGWPGLHGAQIGIVTLIVAGAGPATRFRLKGNA